MDPSETGDSSNPLADITNTINQGSHGNYYATLYMCLDRFASGVGSYHKHHKSMFTLAILILMNQLSHFNFNKSMFTF
jgi:hypothetical protein